MKTSVTQTHSASIVATREELEECVNKMSWPGPIGTAIADVLVNLANAPPNSAFAYISIVLAPESPK